jgi:hypothetical protein
MADQGPTPESFPQLFPRHGRGVDDVIADLQAKREHDVKWQEGRAFGMIY